MPVMRKKESQNSTTDLLACHCLSASNFLHAHRLGGLAAPSIAIVKPQYPLLNFGDITLLSSLDLVDPKNPAVKVFGADVYSARYPSVEVEVDAKALEALHLEIRPSVEHLGTGDITAENLRSKGIDALSSSPAFLRTYLLKKGLSVTEPWLKGLSVESEATLREHGFGAYIDAKTIDIFDLCRDETFVNLCLSFRKKEISARMDGKGDKFLKTLIAKLQPGSEFARNVVSSMAHELLRHVRLRNSPEIDTREYVHLAHQEIEEARLLDDFHIYMEDVFESLKKNEKIFVGFTPSGNRKYIPHTIENVIKIMKSGISSDGEYFFMASGVSGLNT